VVLEAGTLSPVVGFAAISKALAADHRVIAYDRAGYDASASGDPHIEKLLIEACLCYLERDEQQFM
jgi:hypothetical protein